MALMPMPSGPDLRNISSASCKHADEEDHLVPQQHTEVTFTGNGTYQAAQV